MAAGKVPALIVIRLPDDHTADPRPEDGYAYRASYVADNDLALGRIVAFLSRTPIWKDSAVFVTEEDAQGGVDHVDAHRSILLVASPWVKPGVIAHGHSSMGSITRTIDELLGLGPLNLEDALSGNLAEIFDSSPHLESFKVQVSDGRVFVPAKAKVARPKTKKEAAALRDMDDAHEIRDEMEKSAGSLPGRIRISRPGIAKRFFAGFDRAAQVRWSVPHTIIGWDAGSIRVLKLLAISFFQCNRSREQHIVLEVDVLMQILLELVQASVKRVIRGAGAHRGREVV